MDEDRLLELLRLHSLQRVEDLDIHGKWKNASWPYSKGEKDGVTEKLWICDGVKVYEEFDDKQGAKLGFNSTNGTYFYEQWGDGRLLKLWKTSELQWGELHESPSHTTEKWSQSATEKSYEVFTIASESERTGRKFGCKEGVRWFERWSEGVDCGLLEKWWEADDRSWGEKFGHDGARKWSERWELQGDNFLSQTANEEGSKCWGKIEGRYKDESWGEEWSNDDSERRKDKHWQRDGRTWGTKETVRGEERITEDWEECGSQKKRHTSRIDPDGNMYQTTTGSGDEYEYTDTYERVAGVEISRKRGFHAAESWDQEYTCKDGVHIVKNEGRNDFQTWTEMWREDGTMKSAVKTGKTNSGEEWEESWSESSDLKECYKYGKSAEEEWWEEWSESQRQKHCRKRRKKGDDEQTQEWWEKDLGPTLRRCYGYIAENGKRVKEWDDVYQPIEDH